MNFEIHLFSGNTKAITHKIENISSRVFEEIKTCKKDCLFAIEIEEKFHLVIENYFEFEKELLNFTEKIRIWSDRSLKHLMINRLKLDRRIVNCLTSCRLFLDQIDHGVSKICGKSSEELKRLKKYKNKIYDSNLGYRFMEFLRNSVQHQELPVHSISIEDNYENNIKYLILKPIAMLSKLKENTKLKDSVYKDLRELGDNIDLRPFLREYCSCFYKIYCFLKKMLDKRFENSVNSYRDYCIKYKQSNDVRNDLGILFKKDDSGNVLEQFDLNENFFDYYDMLVRENNITENFLSTFTANR